MRTRWWSSLFDQIRNIEYIGTHCGLMWALIQRTGTIYPNKTSSNTNSGPPLKLPPTTLTLLTPPNIVIINAAAFAWASKLEGSVKSHSVLHLWANSESSETSNIPYPLSVHVPSLISYFPCSVPIHPCSSFSSDPSLSPCDWQSCSSVFLMPLYHVSTQPHVPRSLLPRTPIPVPTPPPHLRTPFVFKLCISFDTRQSDYGILIIPVCVYSVYITCIIFSPCSLHSTLCSLLRPPPIPVQPLSDCCPTPASNLCPEIIGHTANRMSGCNT